MRVELVKKALDADGHDCVVLNTGKSRTVPSPHYETVAGAGDFVSKVFRFSAAGYTVHEHLNGESVKGLARSLTAAAINLLTGKRCIVTFHAGTEQKYFPKQNARLLAPFYFVLFTIARRIICNSEGVRARIAEYGVVRHKIVSIPAFTRQYLEFTPVPLPGDMQEFRARFQHVLFTYIRVRPGFNLDTLLDGFARLAVARQDVGLLIVGMTDDIDPVLLAHFEERLATHSLRSRVHIIDEFDHDMFLTALTHSSVYVRTPTSDGVASSVLEAMALRVPVVAAENGARPQGVITFDARDPESLTRALEFALAHRESIVESMPSPLIEDTLTRELAVLTGDIEYLEVQPA